MELQIIQRSDVLQDGDGVLRFRFAHLQLDPAEYMGMPAANTKHVFIIREAFNVGGFQARARQQEFGWL